MTIAEKIFSELGEREFDDIIEECKIEEKHSIEIEETSSIGMYGEIVTLTFEDKSQLIFSWDRDGGTTYYHLVADSKERYWQF